MKKATPALLLGGLALAACLQAQAAEPQAATGADNAVMVGIDAKTHQLRPLTSAEANALATRAAAMPHANTSWAKAPRTPAQARATLRHHGKSASMRVPTSAMSSAQVVRAADGSLQFSETDGDAMPSAPQSQEVTK